MRSAINHRELSFPLLKEIVKISQPFKRLYKLRHGRIKAQLKHCLSDKTFALSNSLVYIFYIDHYHCVKIML